MCTIQATLLKCECHCKAVIWPAKFWASKLQISISVDSFCWTNSDFSEKDLQTTPWGCLSSCWSSDRGSGRGRGRRLSDWTQTLTFFSDGVDLTVVYKPGASLSWFSFSRGYIAGLLLVDRVEGMWRLQTSYADFQIISVFWLPAVALISVVQHFGASGSWSLRFHQTNILPSQ